MPKFKMDLQGQVLGAVQVALVVAVVFVVAVIVIAAFMALVYGMAALSTYLSSGSLECFYSTCIATPNEITVIGK